MALLAFDDSSKSPLASLLDNSQRQKTASELNAAILTSLAQEKGIQELCVVCLVLFVRSGRMGGYKRVGDD